MDDFLSNPNVRGQKLFSNGLSMGSLSAKSRSFSRDRKQADAWRGESRHWMAKVRHERTQHGQNHASEDLTWTMSLI